MIVTIPATKQAGEIHGQEIRQESLKSTLQSAITDLEQDLTGIKSVYNSQTLHVENLIFVSESQGEIAVI